MTWLYVHCRVTPAVPAPLCFSPAPWLFRSLPLPHADMSRAASVEPDFYTQAMNVLCPLDDECLPLEAANLKTRQVWGVSGVGVCCM